MRRGDLVTFEISVNYHADTRLGGVHIMRYIGVLDERKVGVSFREGIPEWTFQPGSLAVKDITYKDDGAWNLILATSGAVELLNR